MYLRIHSVNLTAKKYKFQFMLKSIFSLTMLMQWTCSLNGRTHKTTVGIFPSTDIYQTISICRKGKGYMDKVNLTREIKELKAQFSYSKNIGFFFGAGSSCALGIPNIEQITVAVEAKLSGSLLKDFKVVKSDLETTHNGKKINIEDILNHVRRIRDITGEKDFKNYLGINGTSSKELDQEICKAIYSILTEKEELYSKWIHQLAELTLKA